MIRSHLLALAVLLLLLGGLPAAPQQDKPSTDTAALVKGNTHFALDLYGQLRSRDGNQFFAPFSISTVLAMTSAGAKGQTLDQMAKVLHLPEQKKLHPAFAALIKQVNRPRKGTYELMTANALWEQKGSPFLKEFETLNKDYYHAGLKEVDFKDNVETSRKDINTWVEKQTNNMIKDLFPAGSLSVRTRLVLTNAIYFKAAWADPFNARHTRDRKFTVAKDKKVDVKLMTQTDRFPYHEGKHSQMLELPYKGGDLAMVVLLPRKVDGLEALEKKLTPEKLTDWMSKLKQTQVNVKLPRFKIAAQVDLVKTLISMGMPDAFGTKADFSGLDGGKGKLYLDAVLHKAVVEVGEKGTEAAAATGVVVVPRGKLPEKTKEFRADHPFLFLIRDRRSGSILFLGRLVDPSAK